MQLLIDVQEVITGSADGQEVWVTKHNMRNSTYIHAHDMYNKLAWFFTVFDRFCV